MSEDRFDAIAREIWGDDDLKHIAIGYGQSEWNDRVKYSGAFQSRLAALLREREGDEGELSDKAIEAINGAITEIANGGGTTCNSVEELFTKLDTPALPQNWQEAVREATERGLEYYNSFSQHMSEEGVNYRDEHGKNVCEDAIYERFAAIITSHLSPLVEAVRGEVKAISNLCEDASAEWFEVRKHSRAALALLGEKAKEETSNG